MLFFIVLWSSPLSACRIWAVCTKAGLTLNTVTDEEVSILNSELYDLYIQSQYNPNGWSRLRYDIEQTYPLEPLMRSEQSAYEDSATYWQTVDMLFQEGAGKIGIGHAFGFVQRRICEDDPIPFVPIMLNTFYPPNQASPKRCFQFGNKIAKAIQNWNSDQTVGIVASGGLSHFVIDEEHDARMIEGFKNNDEEAITGEPDKLFRSGTSETKNWITVAGILKES